MQIDRIETGLRHLKITPIFYADKKTPKPRPFVCDICDSRYVWKVGLRNHIVHAHMKEIPKEQKTSESHPFVCGICGRRYTNKCGLSKHIRRVHIERRPQRQATQKGKENLATNIDASCLPEDAHNKR